MTDKSPHAVLDELAGLPRGDDLARLVHTVAFTVADERRADFSSGVTEAAATHGITFADAETRFGNVLRALERGGAAEPAGAASRVLLATLLARGVALSPPDGPAAEQRVADALVWLAAHTAIDALASIDAVMGDRAAGLWHALAALLRHADAGTGSPLGRPATIVAAAALRQSAAPAARAEVNTLADEVRDPILRTLLRTSGPLGPASDAGAGPGSVPAASTSSVLGQLETAPRGPVTLVLLAFSGLLGLFALGRLIGRFILGYRRPAELRVTARGVSVLARTELLGRVLRQREVHIPVESLQRVTREIRFPRVAMYAGLVALALGSYLGVSLFVDGARAASPEFLGIGLLIVALGVALDFALGNAESAAAGRCRVVLVPRRGPALAVGGVDPAHADAALARLVRHGSA